MRGGVVAGLVGGLIGLALAGCNHDEGLVFSDPPDAGPADLSPSMDDLVQSACRTHQILSVPLDDVEVVNPVWARIGSSLLVRVAFSLREGCDVPGDINVRVMPGNATDFVVITMRSWRGSNDCGPPKTAWRILTLGPDLAIGNPMVLITDGAPGGTRMVHAQLARSPMIDCSASRGLLAACEGDCQCMRDQPARRCLPTANGDFRCNISCSEDAECPLGDPVSENHCGTGWVCVQSGCTGSPCCQPTDCTFGQECPPVESAYCRPIPAVLGGSCNCDGDCGTGRLCDQMHSCFIPCTTAADCGAPATICDGGRCR